jgi:carboxyl-terminal processing protease
MGDTQVTVPNGTEENFKLIVEAWQTVQNQYVDQSAVDPQTLTYGAISGMVEALGDTGHSRFLTPEMLAQEHQLTSGEFEGIGAEVQMKNGHVVIVAPIDGSPAQKAGVKPGDIFVAVNGEDVTGQTLEEVVGKVLGPAGTKVQITLRDPETGQERTLTIERARIKINNVTWNMIPGTQIAHLRIAAFSNGVTDDLKNALQEIQDQGSNGIILDLRNDPGGLLSEAVGVASQFLEDGLVLKERNAQGDIQDIAVESSGIATDIPMVVLVNEGSASAAEIVAGALRDNGRAQIVGNTTFGTGTVLNEFRLSDQSALLLATQEWLTPKGNTIWHKGIEPDITVSLPEDATILLPEEEAVMSSDEFLNTQDEQLLKALEVLNQEIQSGN